MKSLFSIYLRVLAVVVYVQFISSQLYDPTGDGAAETIYRILDPLLVLGMIVVVYYAYQRKTAVDAASDDSVTREYLGGQRSLLFECCPVYWPAVELGRLSVLQSCELRRLAVGYYRPIVAASVFASSVQLLKSEE